MENLLQNFIKIFLEKDGAIEGDYIRFKSIDAAQKYCLLLPKCGGITKVEKEVFELRFGKEFKSSKRIGSKIYFFNS